MRAVYQSPSTVEVRGGTAQKKRDPVEVTICGYVYDSVTHDTLAVIKFDSGDLASVYLTSLKAL